MATSFGFVQKKQGRQEEDDDVARRAQLEEESEFIRHIQSIRNIAREDSKFAKELQSQEEQETRKKQEEEKKKTIGR